MNTINVRSEVRRALLKAAADLHTPERSATLKEMAERACVGAQCARWVVVNMRREGHLTKVRERCVAYRNRPVVEYAPTELLPVAVPQLALQGVMRVWAA